MEDHCEGPGLHSEREKGMIQDRATKIPVVDMMEKEASFLCLVDTIIFHRHVWLVFAQSRYEEKWRC